MVNSHFFGGRINSQGEDVRKRNRHLAQKYSYFQKSVNDKKFEKYHRFDVSSTDSFDLLTIQPFSCLSLF